MRNLRLHALVGCVLRSLLIVRRLVLIVAIAVSLSAVLFLTDYAPISELRFYGFTAAILVIAPITAGLVSRGVLTRDGWTDDRPRAVVLPVSGPEYLVAIIAASVLAATAIACVGFAVVAYGAVSIGKPRLLVALPTITAMAIGIALAIAAVHTLAAVISRRLDATPLVFGATSLVVTATTFGFRTVAALIKTRTYALSLIAIVAVIAVCGVVALWRKAVREFDSPYG